MIQNKLNFNLYFNINFVIYINMSSILNDIDDSLNQVDAWMLKKEFDEYKKATDKFIYQLDIQLNVANHRIEELDAFVKYLEYKIFELEKDVNN